jgi:hypothetical protein
MPIPSQGSQLDMHADNFGEAFVAGSKVPAANLLNMHADSFGEAFVVNPPLLGSGGIILWYWMS